MGLLDRAVIRLLDPATRPRAYAVDDDYWFTRVIAPTASGVEIDETNALEVSAVYKSVKILAESIASLPLHMYRRVGDTKNRAHNHALYDLMHTKPNPEMSSMQYREAQVAHVALWGGHFSEKELSRDGRTKALWPLLPNRVEPFRTDAKELAYKLRLPTGETIILRREQVLHIPGFSFNGVTGLSPIGHMRESLGLAKATQQFGARLFSNDARPGGVLEHPQKLDDEAFKRLEKTWGAAHAGLSNAHRIAILEEGMKFNTIGIPPDDAQFLETRKFQDEDIYGMFRIPPHLAADLDHATYTNIIEQSLEFVIYTLYPWLVRIEQALNIQLLSDRDRKRYFFEHLIEGLLRGDPEKRWAAYRVAREMGVLSPNDIRRLENMNPIPAEKGGDDYHIPAQWLVAGAPKPEPQPIAPAIEAPTPAEDEQTQQRALFPSDLFMRDASRVMRRETAAIKNLAKKHIGAGKIDAFQDAFEDYYEKMPAYLERELLPTLKSYAQAISGNTNGDAIDLPDIPADYIDESLAQLNRLINDCEGVSADLLAAVNRRMDEWSFSRPQELMEQALLRIQNELI